MSCRAILLPAGTQGDAHGNFFLTRGPARQHEIGYVGAGQEQYHTYGTQQGE